MSASVGAASGSADTGVTRTPLAAALSCAAGAARSSMSAAINSAMRGIEEEPIPYGIKDIKEKFS